MHMLASRPDRWDQRGELAQLLLDKSADPMRLTARQATPLHTAAGTCNFAVAKVLLSHPDVKVNAKNKDNKHPWDWASSNAAMRELLEKKGGVESPNKTGGSRRRMPVAEAGRRRSGWTALGSGARTAAEPACAWRDAAFSQRNSQASVMLVPCRFHASYMRVSRKLQQVACKSHASCIRHASAMQVSCTSHASVMQVLCKGHASILRVACECHASFT